jgi:hypothetical protein
VTTARAASEIAHDVLPDLPSAIALPDQLRAGQVHVARLFPVMNGHDAGLDGVVGRARRVADGHGPFEERSDGPLAVVTLLLSPPVPKTMDVAVPEMGEDECGAGDVADFARAGSDVAEGAPEPGEQDEPAFAQAAQGPLDGIAGASSDTVVEHRPHRQTAS